MRVSSSHIESKINEIQYGDDYVIKLTLVTEEIFLFRTEGGIYKILPVLQSTRKDCRQASRQDSRRLLELRSYIIIVSFGSNLHFATFIRYTHFENISIALVDILYR